MYGAIRAIGFTDVIEVAQGAMETIENEGAELVEKLEEGQKFMTTSCCPSYIELSEKHVPEIKPYISSTGSPMYYTARIAKKKYPDAKNRLWSAPLHRKRKEARRDECVDYVMTFEEIDSVFKGMGIEIGRTESYGVPFVSTRSAHGFARAAACWVAVKLRLAGTREVNGVQIAGLNRKSIALLKAYASRASVRTSSIEVMACEGGCVTGPSTHNNHTAARRFSDRN